MCEDIWLRPNAGVTAALSRQLTGSVGLVSLLLHMMEEFGHRLQVKHMDAGQGCLVRAAQDEGARVTH